MTDTTKQVPSLKRVPCEVYSRIVGYLRPVRDWNVGKQQEFAERKMYNVRELSKALEEAPVCAENKR